MSVLRAVYGLVIFLSAFLLFLGEPMAAKQLLPVLGGSSAVWVTCLVFFQATLLLGYLYAYWMVRWGRRWVHLLLLAAPIILLGLFRTAGVGLGARGVDVRLGSSASTHPVTTIFALLGATIGLPFFVLSSTGPLLQVWWARLHGGVVPYKLFALSNAGSLLALAAYPLLVEPHVPLHTQWTLWGVGYFVYAAASGWLAWGRAEVSVAPQLPERDAAGTAQLERRTNGKTRAMWFLLPMVAAMQLTAVTSHLSQDIAAIPLLWVLPLAVYLGTFVLAFEAPHLYRRWLVVRLLAVMLASLGYALSNVDKGLPVGIAILIYLVDIFIVCWFCHAEVYKLRPAGAEESTVFYLLLTAGGVTGTFLVAIASPLIFRANYDLGIVFLLTALLAARVTWDDGWEQRALWSTASVLLLALTLTLRGEFNHHALMRARNFYGALRVTETDYDDSFDEGGKTAGRGDSIGSGPVRTLLNGRIRHGTQMISAGRRQVPTTYYGEDSGVGMALRYCCEGRRKNVGVIGLGAGTIAAYGEAGDRIRFYEINPLVEPIARNLFTYLRDSQAAISIVNGDGRMSLSSESPHGFDVLVVDAFSGDAVPLHLLTQEAMEVYLRQLAPGGVIAFHASNSYVDLVPEIRVLADEAGMKARVVESFEAPADGEYRATWVLVSADAGFFSKPGVEAAAPIARVPGLQLWTDDYSSLLPVLRLGW